MSKLIKEMLDMEKTNTISDVHGTKAVILLAEDNEANIETFCSYLSAFGYEIIIANNGKEAIEIATTATLDLILMDIQMPIMDGFEAILTLRKEPKLDRVPIVALTALALVGDRERCLAAGANEYLSKPVKMKLLVTTIRELLGEI
ncbi:MAG: response regulator [Microcoleus sp.]|uniref:response regulator n=2 Tax=Microcoleus TaxID=44471 RepID=UPI003525DE9E